MLDEIPVINSQIDEPNQVNNKVQGALSVLANLAGTREVEIDLPILKTKVFVQPVNGSEELQQRTMKVSGAAFIESFNKVIFEHCRFDSVEFKNLKDFQDNLTPPDKALLVYALLDSTFTKLPEKVITCPSCGKTNTYTLSPSELLHADTITKEWNNKQDILEYEINSEVVPGFNIIYAMPTETERIQILKDKENSELRENIKEHNDVLNPMELLTIYVKRIEIKKSKDSKDSKDDFIILDDKINEILPTLTKTPLELQSKLLEDTSLKEFIDYNPNFYLDIHCENLGCEVPDFKWDKIDPEQDFFLKALSVYN